MPARQEKWYRGRHNWVERQLGKPSKCEGCMSTSQNPWCYHWANISGQYLKELGDWKRLCARCHRKFDNSIYQATGRGNHTKCGAGHTYTPETTKIHKQGHRVCRICVKQYTAMYNKRKREELVKL